MQHGDFTYIMTNRPDGVLYVGVTADIHQRMHQHRALLGSRFCQKYGINMLVLVERHETIQEAIARE